MLLDFHLSREPLRPGCPGPQGLGGTLGYMAPEQLQAFLALRRGEPVPCAVDRRADVYALGRVLHQALAGSLTESSSPLHRLNPSVSVGLSDIVARCLAASPEARYQSASDLADDLRRQLAGLPLRGVANRSLAERWRKWRKRRPHTLALVFALLALLTAGLAGLNQMRRHYRDAEAALQTGLSLLGQGQLTQAREQLERGRATAASLPGSSTLLRSFERSLLEVQDGLDREERQQVRRRLHSVVEQLRLLAVAESLSRQQVQSLERACRELWERRHQVFDPGQVRDPLLCRDLLDLAIVWGSLMSDHREALRLLTEAERSVARARPWTEKWPGTARGQTRLRTLPGVVHAPPGITCSWVGRCWPPIGSTRPDRN